MSFFDTYEEFQNKLNKYKIIKELGRGAHGKAYLCSYNNNTKEQQQQQCVLKQISLNLMSEEDLQKQYSEVSILKQVSHPNIVKFQDAFIFKNKYLCIVMDYAQGGDLEQRITQAINNKTPFDNKTILKWFTQLCSAIRHLHEKKIMHRDIKNSNILLDSQDNILICDFGISKRLANSKDLANTIIGTPYFMAPELCNCHAYTFKVDIWALGVVLFRLVYLEYPFDAEQLFLLQLAISKGDINYPNKPITPFKNIISKLLQLDSNLRPSIDQVFELDEIKQYINESILGKQQKEHLQKQARIQSGRGHILKDNNSGQFELQKNRPFSSNKNLLKDEQKLLDFAQQNYLNLQKNKSSNNNNNNNNNIRDKSPKHISNNFSTPKLPCLKQNQNQKQKGIYPDIKASPSVNNLKNGQKQNLENDKNFFNNKNNINNNMNNVSPNRIKKQYSDCSTSESNKEVTPKVFSFNKIEENSPYVGGKKNFKNELSDVKNINSPFNIQKKSQNQIRFSAKKENKSNYNNDQSGVKVIPCFNPHNNVQSKYNLNNPPNGLVQLQPVIKQNRLYNINNNQNRASLQIKNNEILAQKLENLQPLQHFDTVRNLKKKEFILSPVQNIIPAVFNKNKNNLVGRNSEKDNFGFGQAIKDYVDDTEHKQQQLDDSFGCQINPVISTDFLENPPPVLDRKQQSSKVQFKSKNESKEQLQDSSNSDSKNNKKSDQNSINSKKSSNEIQQQNIIFTSNSFVNSIELNNQVNDEIMQSQQNNFISNNSNNDNNVKNTIVFTSNSFVNSQEYTNKISSYNKSQSNNNSKSNYTMNNGDLKISNQISENNNNLVKDTLMFTSKSLVNSLDFNNTLSKNNSNLFNKKRNLSNFNGNNGDGHQPNYQATIYNNSNLNNIDEQSNKIIDNNSNQYYNEDNDNSSDSLNIRKEQSFYESNQIEDNNYNNYNNNYVIQSNSFLNNKDDLTYSNNTQETISRLYSVVSQNKQSYVQSQYYSNPEELIENRKKELIELLGENLYLKISHYTSKLIQHPNFKNNYEDRLKKQFIIMCNQEGRNQDDFNIDSAVFNLLKIVCYEENFDINF